MPVTAGLARQHAGIVVRPPQPRDLRLHRVPAYADGVGPEVIDEAIGAHLDAGIHRQAHEQLRAFPSGAGSGRPRRRTSRGPSDKICHTPKV
jgi:hypothetical protein